MGGGLSEIMGAIEKVKDQFNGWFDILKSLSAK
jgi:hypothetical protein